MAKAIEQGDIVQIKSTGKVGEVREVWDSYKSPNAGPVRMASIGLHDDYADTVVERVRNLKKL